MWFSKLIKCTRLAFIIILCASKHFKQIKQNKLTDSYCLDETNNIYKTNHKCLEKNTKCFQLVFNTKNDYEDKYIYKCLVDDGSVTTTTATNNNGLNF